MKHILKQTGLFWLWVSLLVVGSDQYTKHLIIDRFQLHESLPVIPMFSLTYHRNEGAAFSFLSDAGGWQLWFFSAIAFGVVSMLLFWLYQQQRQAWRLNIAYTLIIGGAIGNVWDRLQYGYVVDFIDVYWQQYHFPIFNIADTAISIGAFMMILDAFFEIKQQKSKQ
jgi:signal peptidase II